MFPSSRGVSITLGKTLCPQVVAAAAVTVALVLQTQMPSFDELLSAALENDENLCTLLEHLREFCFRDIPFFEENEIWLAMETAIDVRLTDKN